MHFAEFRSRLKQEQHCFMQLLFQILVLFLFSPGYPKAGVCKKVAHVFITGYCRSITHFSCSFLLADKTRVEKMSVWVKLCLAHRFADLWSNSSCFICFLEKIKGLWPTVNLICLFWPYWKSFGQHVCYSGPNFERLNLTQLN